MPGQPAEQERGHGSTHRGRHGEEEADQDPRGGRAEHPPEEQPGRDGGRDCSEESSASQPQSITGQYNNITSIVFVLRENISSVCNEA